jgi:GTP-binding protein Era
MMQEVYEALEHRDIVVLLVDASRRIAPFPKPIVPRGANFGASENGNPEPSAQGRFSPSHQQKSNLGKSDRDREDAFVYSLVRKLDCPVFLVLNKIDLIAKDKLLPLIAQLSSLHDFAAVIPISARKKDGLDLLVAKLIEHLPKGERYFPKEQFTDQPERFLVAELIRERILAETGEEVPYASAVVVERFEEPEAVQQKSPGKAGKHHRTPSSGPSPQAGTADRDTFRGLTRISAAIYCERPGQKAILIGKGGSKLKSIGTAARKEIESLLGTRVYLELRVIVQENWRESRGFLDSLNWRKQLEDLALSQAAKETNEE